MNGKGKEAALLRWILLVTAVVALIVVVRLLPVARWLLEFQAWAAHLGPAAGMIYGFVYIGAALLFIPGSILTLGAGVVFGLVWGTVIVSLASTVAAALAFLVARYAARRRIEEVARGNQKFHAIDQAIGLKGWKVVLLLRLSPVVPFSLSNYLYGLTAVRFWPYVVASWAGMLPGTVLYIYLGMAGRSAAAGGARNVWEWILLGAGLAATVFVTILLARVARRQLQKSKLESE